MNRGSKRRFEVKIKPNIVWGSFCGGGGLRFRGRAKFGKPAETVRNLKY